MKKLTVVLLALAAFATLNAQTAFQPGVPFTDGTLTAVIAGPTLPCPPAFNWPCTALNTSQYVWFYASTTDPSINSFQIAVTYTPADGGPDVTVRGYCSFPAVLSPGQLLGMAVGELTLPFPATVKSATISPVVVKQTSSVVF